MPTVPQRWRTFHDQLARWLDPPWRRRRSGEARAWSWAALGTTLACYLLACLTMGAQAGVMVTALYALPLVLAGWAFGASGGILVALAAAPIHAWIFGAGIVPPTMRGLGPALLGLGSALLVGASVGSARDLRERLRESAALLAESEDRYRQLVDNSPEGVLVHERGVVVFANPSMARLVGAPDAGALVGRTLVTFAPFEDREAFGERLVFARDARRNVPVRLARPDADAMPVEMTTMPIQYRGGGASLVLVRPQ